MLEELTATCEDCDADLNDAAFGLAMDLGDGERRLYECGCGAVTVTVVRDR
ncbi:hypothetical protein [Halorubellus sp. PRR65]|uniref:hypothetical protein n=1 Tax=Halorubellus sp. PRR65 TaxID=3098148 RepID=UPI002B25713F|nr:hypothetical protein [Halorubellus sp. PRR65]